MTLTSNIKVGIEDSFNAQADENLTGITSALQPKLVVQAFRQLKIFAKTNTSYKLLSIRVLRYKPNKRCLLEYCFGRDAPAYEHFTPLILLGKIRASRSGKKEYRQQRQLQEHGFADTAANPISVPDTLAHIPSLNMWLQRKVAGTTLTSLLQSPRSIALMPRIAEAAWKIHNTPLQLPFTHSVDDALAQLQQRMLQLYQTAPQLERRIAPLLKKATLTALAIQKQPYRTIHRDYYADQIIVSPDKSRIFIVDNDIICNGNPTLDIGNFNAHLIEYSIRHLNHPNALTQCQQQFVNRYVALSGEQSLYPIQVYTYLTLLRHISISYQMPERKRCTNTIIETCETFWHKSTQQF